MTARAVVMRFAGAAVAASGAAAPGAAAVAAGGVETVCANQLASLSFSVESTTWPSSPSRTGAPPRHATTSERNAAASVSWPSDSTATARCRPHSVPVGRLTFARWTAPATSSSPRPRAASACGSSCTRTAYFCAPKTCTCATPLTVETRGAIIVSAYSLTVHSGSVGDDSARNRIGWSAGLTFRKEGGVGMPVGRRGVTCEIADCTS